jgi:hypothetical protein
MRIICYSCEYKVECEYGHEHWIEGVAYTLEECIEKYPEERVSRAFAFGECPECGSGRCEID